MEPICYLNGEIVLEKDAKVGVHDLGILRGFGIYQALRTVGRKPFMLDKHLARFRNSAEVMTLTIPATDTELAGIIDTLIAHNIPEGKEARVKFILTGGESLGGIEPGPTPTFYILVDTFSPLPVEVYEKGCSLIVHEYQRAFAENKTTSYAQAVILQKARKAAGALEILYTSQGFVLECAMSNIFFVKSGVVLTPKQNILEGVTRTLVVDIAQKAFPLEERQVSVDEAFSADEVFITGSFKNIVPVVEIGGRKIGSGVPGLCTKRLMVLFDEFTRPKH